VRSPNLQLFDDLFEGADAAIAKAKETGKFDYDAPMEGLLAADRYTIRIKLKRPSYDLLSNLTHNVEEEIRVLRQSQGMPATQVIPPNVTGHDPGFFGNTKYDPQGAKALLDKFGYVDRDKDRRRDLPDGKPLVLNMGTSPSALDRQSTNYGRATSTRWASRSNSSTRSFPISSRWRSRGNLKLPRRPVQHWADCAAT